jgi:ABC-type glycerol-3-phosphate transport system substrate-binding protein
MKKTNLIISIVALATMLLTACGGAVTTQAPAAAATQAPAAAATQAPAAAATQAPAASGAKVNLVFWSMWNKTEPSAIAYTQIIANFEAKYPNITISPVWNGRENQTKARTALGGGTVIDLVDQDASQIAGGMEQEGVLLPLEDLLNSPDLDEPGTAFKDIFNPGALDMYVKDGQHYLIPYDDNPIMFFYNKDAFTKAGITAPPATWDDFLADCAKIKATGVDPIALESDYFNEWYFSYLVERIKGPGFLLKSIEDKTGAAWNDPVYTQALGMIQDLWTKGYIPDSAHGNMWPAGEQSMGMGKTAMELVGSWVPTELLPTTGPNFNWGAFNFPAVAGGVGKSTDLQQALLSIGVIKASKHPQEAELFIKFLLTAQSQKLMTAQLRSSTRKGIPWPAPVMDAYNAVAGTTQILDEMDGGAYLYAEFTNNVLTADIVPVIQTKATVAAFPAKMSADAKNYWANH